MARAATESHYLAPVIDAAVVPLSMLKNSPPKSANLSRECVPRNAQVSGARVAIFIACPVQSFALSN